MAKLNKEQLSNRIAEFRKTYKKEDLFVASDGGVFLTKAPAETHAKTLIGKNEIPKDLGITHDVVAKPKQKDTDKGGDLTEDAAKEQLLAIVVKDTNKDVLVSIAEALEAEVKEPQNKAEYVDALEAIQNQLKEA